MRIFKYDCPAQSGNPDSPYAHSCFYPWNVDGSKEPCVRCGKTSKETRTVWDQLRNLYLDIVPFEARPRNAWYTFKCWAWKRYTTVKPRKLDHGWCDRCALLPHVMFEVLCNFVEEELVEDRVNWESDDNHSHAKREMLDLYTWWTSTEGVDNGYFYLSEIEQQIWKDKYHGDETAAWLAYDQFVLDQCKRLVTVSPYMWT